MIVDDIHSAEKTFLDLLDHFGEAIDRSPVLVLCSARRELEERHPDWTEAHAPALIVLEPLSDADAGQIVEQILGGAGLEPDVIAKITAAAEGNPLFVEQMVSMLIDNGTLRNEDGRWIASAASEISVPPSITALLAARLDSLPQDERAVVEPASVIGLSFPVPALEELLDESYRPSLLPSLQAVERKQFVRATTLDEDEAYRFAHILVRDTAYGSLLKRLRASYHERFVDWAERVNAERGRGQEFEEIHGYHLEQAYRYLTELGVVDEAARQVGQRASAKLASAGRRALGRGDISAAANLLRRATETRERSDPQRLEIVPDLGMALVELGDYAEAAGRLQDVMGLATELGSDVVEGRAAVVMCFVRMYSGDFDPASIMAEVNRALKTLESGDDEQGLMLAWRVRLMVYARAGRWSDLAMASQRVIEHARAIGDVRTETRASVGYADAVTYGPTPTPVAIAECEVLLARTAGDRTANSKVRLALAQLYARAGDFDRARSLYGGVREQLADGRAGVAVVPSLAAAVVEILAGDPAAAERELQIDHDVLTAVGERSQLPTVDAFLARALLEQGRADEAAVRAEQVKRMAMDDTDAQAICAGVLAGVAAARGHTAEAVAFAQEAVALRREEQSPVDLVDALGQLAKALVFAGRYDEAKRTVSEGLSLADEKGDVVTRRHLESILAAV
jgi:tetratricopeptide (TPR) repeat protein